MLNILSIEHLDSQEMTIKQRLRITRSRKAYAVFIDDTLYLVNDLERLFFDRLKAENIYNALIYQLK